MHMCQEKMRGTQREAQGVGRDMSCPRKLFLDERKSVLPRSQVLSEKRKWRCTWKVDEYLYLFKHQTEVGLHADVSENRFPLEQRLPLVKNNFRGYDTSQGLDRESPSLSPHFLMHVYDNQRVTD